MCSSYFYIFLLFIALLSFLPLSYAPYLACPCPAQTLQIQFCFNYCKTSEQNVFSASVLNMFCSMTMTHKQRNIEQESQKTVFRDKKNMESCNRCCGPHRAVTIMQLVWDNVKRQKTLSLGVCSWRAKYSVVWCSPHSFKGKDWSPSVYLC